MYFPLREAGERLKLVADVPSGPYWILGPVDLPAPEYRPLVKKLGEAVAYWLWQVDAELSPAGDTNDVPGFAQSVHMEIEPDPLWFARGEGEDAPDAVSCTRVDAATVRLRFGSGSANLFGLQDNSGDRRLLRELLRVLGENDLVDGRVQRRPLSDERVEEVLAIHAPLGLKKKFFLVPGGIDPRLNQAESPSLRHIQEHDEEIQLDEVGAFVRDELGYGVGPIPADERAEVLRRVVDSRFDVLESLVASLGPAGLLETLVEHHEAILSAQALLQLTTPTRLACFAGSDKIGAQLEKERNAVAQAATASRVLIEYVAATPPSGDRPLSLATYDRLLAAISQLQQWAFTSDEIHYGLVDHPLEILPSGRLGMERGAYLTARSAFSVARQLGEMGRATRDFGRHWREAGDRSPLDNDELARATQEEFGLPLGRLVDLLWAIIAIGRQTSGAAKTVAEPALVASLAEDLGWPDVDVRTGVDLFAARQRPNFRHPAPPFKDNDADPWNYTRALSYLRKPLLAREGADGGTIVWGNGNVYLAGMMLVSLCLGGRYQPRSQALQRIIGPQRENAGEEFNDEVAEYFQGIGNAVVRRRFKKAGRLKIQRASGQDLGDIDILVADPATRRILAVEAKNLAGARTPVEFIGDVREVIEPQGRHSASIDKHLERTAWLHAHRSEVLASIGLPEEDADQWSTEALVVVNIESMAPFLVEPRIKVMSFDELKSGTKVSAPHTIAP